MNTTIRHLRERLRGVLHLDDPPWRIALAFAVGVFISFTPFYGVQTLLAILVATLFRLNKAVTVTAAWINLPWFAPLIYAAGFKLGTRLVPDLEGLSGLSLSLLIGTSLLGLAAAVVTYVVVLSVIVVRRARRCTRSDP